MTVPLFTGKLKHEKRKQRKQWCVLSSKEDPTNGTETNHNEDINFILQADEKSGKTLYRRYLHASGTEK